MLAGILVNEARLSRNGYFRTSAKELRLNQCFQKLCIEIGFQGCTCVHSLQQLSCQPFLFFFCLFFFSLYTAC